MTERGPLSEVLCVRGDAFVMSSANGDIVPGGDQGYYDRDTRFLDRLELRIDGRPPIHLATVSTGGDSALFHACLPPSHPGDADPTVSLVRQRVVDGGLRDRITLRNASAQPVTLDVTLRIGTDFASVQDVKHGRALEEVGASAEERRITTVVTVPARGETVVLVEADTSSSHDGDEDGEDRAEQWEADRQRAGRDRP